VGSTSDVGVFRDNLKQKMLDFGYEGLADGTYQGEPLLTVPPGPYYADTPAQKAF